jgi:hypothetical protein
MIKNKNLVTRSISGEIYFQHICQNLLGRRSSPNIIAISSQKLSIPILKKKNIHKKNHFFFFFALP